MAKHDPSASRDNFRSKWGFKLACIGSAVGMGNIWLFPSRMSQYGATFLIPYFLFVALDVYKRQTRYSVPPAMSRREAEIMALASAWTLRQSS